LEDTSQSILKAVPLLSAPLMIFSLVFLMAIVKGVALWKAASKRQLIWFIILLLLNTLGILDLAYIFYLNRWDIDKGRLLAALEKRFSKAKKQEEQL